MNFNLLCGSYEAVLRDMPLVDVIVTSPPYNIGSKSERKDGKRKLGKYDPKSFGAIRGYPDDLPEDKYQQTQHDFLRWAGEKIKDSGTVVYNHKLRHRDGKIIHPYIWFPENLVLYDEVVWDRGSTHNHCQSFVYQHSERIFVFRRRLAKASPYINKTELRHGDVWRIPRQRQPEKRHDAPFPVELPRRCIRLWCPPGGTVCDPYTGSGTTAVAALMEGRSFYGAEMLPKYHRLAQQRATAAFESEILVLQ